MVPTGSIFGRSWRTRWRGRARLLAVCLVSGLMMLAAASAHAGWRTDLSVQGTPNKTLDLWGPGRFSVGSDKGAYLYLDGGVAVSIPGKANAQFVGTYYKESAGCFVTVNDEPDGPRSSASLAGAGTCQPWGIDINIINQSGLTPVRVRHTEGGVAGILTDGSDTYVYVSEPGVHDIFDANKLTGLASAPGEYTGGPGVLRVGGKLYVVVATRSSSGRVFWAVEGNPFPSPQQRTEVVGAAKAIDMFAAGSPALPYAVVGTQSAILRGSYDPTSNDLDRVWFDGTLLDAGTDAGVTGISVNVDADAGTSGYGFGMATVKLSDGGSAMLSPVPMPDATQAATRWKFRTLSSDIASAPLDQVACSGSSYCVVTAQRPDAGNLFVYTNDALPKFVNPPPPNPPINPLFISVPEGQSREFTFEATDPDGDPVLTLASPPSQGSGTVPVWSAEQVDAGVDGGWLPGDPVVMRFTGGASCEFLLAGYLNLRATDGMKGHDVTHGIPVYVQHTRNPDVPTFRFSKSGLIAGEQEPLLVQTPPSTGCPLDGFYWSARPAGTGLVGPALTHDDAGTATLTAPRTLCVEGGADFPFQLVVKDRGELYSDAGVFQVHVAPWGKPNAVFATADGGTVVAGQERDVSAAPKTHECLGASGFPGVETSWRVTSDRELSDAGITLWDSDGGPVAPGAEVLSPGLKVKTTDCVDTTRLTFTAAHHLKGYPPEFTSPASAQQLVVETSLKPFETGQLLLSQPRVSTPSGELTVDVDSTLNCPARRDLRADLRVSQPGGNGARSVSGQVPIQGTWQVSLGEECLGGRLRLSASMVDKDGKRSPETGMEVVAPPVRASLEPLREDQVLVAQCGQHASTTLTPTFSRGTCQSPAVSWKQLAGPEVDQTPGPDGAVELATKDTGFDALVGRSVVMEVTASVGPDDPASRQQTLPITVEPFVKVNRRTEAPAASDTGLVGVSVELTNGTDCDVNDVSYEERLEGLTYVEGSAQVAGQPGVEVSWKEGSLLVKGLSLPGQGTRRLTYVARPHLVGTRHMEGEARLRDVPISISTRPGPRVDDTGCGCSGSGPGPMLFALGALVAAVRRRATVRR